MLEYYKIDKWREKTLIKLYLAVILEREDMTQAELARKTGIRPATIHEMYHETIARINLEHISKICEVLKCDVQDIMQYIPDKEYYKNHIRKEK